MIQITNYQFLQYLINYNINQDIVTGIYIPNNSKVLEKLFLEISGINKTNGIYFKSKKVYDNTNYFNDRIYLNCNEQILDTLLSKKISNNLLNNYNIVFNTNKFDELVKKLKIRNEGELSSSYKFTKEGICLSNIALAFSTYKYPILLNPLEEVVNTNKMNTLKQLFKEKPSLIGITNLSKYKEILDVLILFGFKDIYILNTNDKLIVLDNIVNQDLTIDEALISNLLIYKCIKNDNLIIKGELSKTQIKALKNLNIKIKEINIYELGDYIC